MWRPPAAKWCARIVLAFACVVFLGAFPYLTAVNNPNENVRTFMTMALVEDGTLKIDRMVQRHGWINDMAKAPDKHGVEHLYSVKGPAVSYAGVVPYWCFVKLEAMRGIKPPAVTAPVKEKEDWLRNATFVMRFFTLQIPCFLFLIWFERFLRGVTSDPVFRGCAVVAAGLGTNYLGYSQMFVSHAAFACAAFGAFAVITRARLEHPDSEKTRSVSTALAAGFLTGLSTVLEYHALVVSAILAIYGLVTFYRPKRLAAFALGGAIDVAVLMLFQWRAYGNPLTPGHKMLENASYKAFHVRGYFGIEPPNGEHIKELILSPTFGFLGTSPFMWLALLAVPAVIFWPRGPKKLHSHERIALAVASIAMIVLVVTVSGAVVWRGGWTIGPRLVGAAPPFFACGAAFGLEQLSRRARFLRTPLRGIAGGLACASVVQIGFVGLMYNTVPEELTRPLPDFAIPFARIGFAPWHLGDVFGVHGPMFFRVVLVCLALAALVAALWPADDRIGGVALRIGIAVPLFYLALRPAFSEPSPGDLYDHGDHGLANRRTFVQIWEPEKSNAIALLREKAERDGARSPCLWGELAHAEKILGFADDAHAHAAKSGGAASCKP